MLATYQTLILAAGMGQRLKPITLTIPKCLAPVLGRPLLEYWLFLLDKGPSPSRIWVNTSYLAEQVEFFLSNAKATYKNLSLTVTFEPKLLGTAGTLRYLSSEFSEQQDLLLTHADNLSWFDLNAFLTAHRLRPRSTEITMMIFESDSPKTCGIVELNEFDILEAFHEKVENPPSNLANGATYLISPAGLAKILALGNVVDFSTEVIPAFLGKIYCWKNSTYHRDIGSPLSYTVAQEEFKLVADKFQLGN